jgi:hypothetical protein
LVVHWVRAVLRRAFTRKAKPPLAQARRHVNAAISILRRHQSDATYRPSANDLAMLCGIEHDLFTLAATASRLVTRLERRFRGEPEVNDAKWRAG